jgi:hypothetical protein
MSAIVSFVTKPARLRQEQVAVLHQALLPFAEGELAPIVRNLITVIARQTAAETDWTFVMLSPDQNAQVVHFLRKSSLRPLVALALWAECFRHLDRQTGEIMATRDELANRIGEVADNVSRVMTELESFGAISRRRVKLNGVRGRGVVRYFMNPRVGTHLAGVERVEAQKSAPKLRIVKTNDLQVVS